MLRRSPECTLVSRVWMSKKRPARRTCPVAHRLVQPLRDVLGGHSEFAAQHVRTRRRRGKPDDATGAVLCFPCRLYRAQRRGLSRSGRADDGVEPVAAEQDGGNGGALIGVQLRLPGPSDSLERIHDDFRADNRAAVVVSCRHDGVLAGERRRVGVEAGSVEVEDAVLSEPEVRARRREGCCSGIRSAALTVVRRRWRRRPSARSGLRPSSSGSGRRPFRLRRGGSSGSRLSVCRRPVHGQWLRRRRSSRG